MGVVIYQAYTNATKFRKELESITAGGLINAQQMTSDFDALVKKLNESEKGSRNFSDALKEINNTYGSYLPNMLTEINYASELAKNYNKVVDAIYNKAKSQALEKSYQVITEKYSEQQQDAIANIIEKMTEGGISKVMHKRLPETLLQVWIKDFPKVKLIWQDSTLSLRSILAVLLLKWKSLIQLFSLYLVHPEALTS